VKDKGFKAELAKATDFGARLQGEVGEIADAVRPFQEAHFWIEVGADLPVVREELQPVVSIVDTCPQVCLSPGYSWGASLNSKASEHKILEKDQTHIRAAVLIVPGR